MSEATLTTKGQITLPADIREAMALNPKDRITFTLMPDGTAVLRAKTKSIKDIKGILKPSNAGSVTIAGMRMSED